GDDLQPGPTVGIHQRRAAAHLFDIGARVKVVGVDEGHAQPFGQRFADGGLAGTRNAHDDDEAGRGGWHGDPVDRDRVSALVAWTGHGSKVTMARQPHEERRFSLYGGEGLWWHAKQ